MTDWKEIGTAPRGTPVLVFDSGDVSVAVLQPSTGQWCGIVDGGLVGIPTKRGLQHFTIGKPSHWMRLPSPPKGAAQ